MKKINVMLEMKEEKNAKETFYRYNIDGNIVWFTQHTEDGNIYGVPIAPNDKIAKHVELHTVLSEFYPERIDVIAVKNRFADENELYEHIEALKYTQELVKAIMSIFEMTEHKNK